MGAVRRLHSLKLATARLTEGEGGLALQSRKSPGPPADLLERQSIASRDATIARIVKQEPDMQLLFLVPFTFSFSFRLTTHFYLDQTTTRLFEHHERTHPVIPLPPIFLWPAPACASGSGSLRLRSSASAALLRASSCDYPRQGKPIIAHTRHCHSAFDGLGHTSSPRCLVQRTISLW